MNYSRYGFVLQAQCVGDVDFPILRRLDENVKTKGRQGFLIEKSPLQVSNREY